MFRQFRRHSRVLRTAARYDYFMLSGGANLFPMSQVWKELLRLEIDYDLAYGWYTSQEGFPTLQRAVSMWENYIASRGRFPVEKPLGSNVCMTLGASQAASAIFDYWASSSRQKVVLLVGLNYALFERLARYYQFQIRELLCEEGTRTLPQVDQVVSLIRKYAPVLVVLTTPNNPSGEQYSEEEIAVILREVVETESLVILDKVGQMPIAQGNWINVGAVIAAVGAQEHSVIVSSFSKSDGVPGFRIGYLLGPERVARHVAHYQLTSTMNPPTVPLLPPFFTFVARCVHTGERLGWMTTDGRKEFLSFARHMFEVTTAIPPQPLLEIMRWILSGEGFELLYHRYVSYQEEVGQAIQRNKGYVFDRLSEYVTRTTILQGGFNFLVEIGPFAGHDEDEICKQLFEDTAIAILTESCFRVSRRCRSNFWVRLSLAAPEIRFCNAIDRFKEFLVHK